MNLTELPMEAAAHIPMGAGALLHQVLAHATVFPHQGRWKRSGSYALYQFATWRADIQGLTDGCSSPRLLTHIHSEKRGLFVL